MRPGSLVACCGVLVPQSRSEEFTCNIVLEGLPSMALCSVCQAISLDQMRGPNRDQILRYQPSCLALKRSAENGCQLCSFFWIALEQGWTSEAGDNHAALSCLSERYPGRELSLFAWGGPEATLDCIWIATAGSLPSSPSSVVSDEDAPSDPTMHPDHQTALSWLVDLYAYPGSCPVCCRGPWPH